MDRRNLQKSISGYSFRILIFQGNFHSSGVDSILIRNKRLDYLYGSPDHIHFFSPCRRFHLYIFYEIHHIDVTFFQSGGVLAAETQIFKGHIPDHIFTAVSLQSGTRRQNALFSIEKNILDQKPVDISHGFVFIPHRIGNTDIEKLSTGGVFNPDIREFHIPDLCSVSMVNSHYRVTGQGMNDVNVVENQISGIFCPYFHTYFNGTGEVVPQYRIPADNIFQIAGIERFCHEPIIPVADKAPFYQHIPGTADVHPIGIAAPADDVDVIDMYIVTTHQTTAPAAAVQNTDIVYFQTSGGPDVHANGKFTVIPFVSFRTDRTKTADFQIGTVFCQKFAVKDCVFVNEYSHPSAVTDFQFPLYRGTFFQNQPSIILCDMDILCSFSGGKTDYFFCLHGEIFLSGRTCENSDIVSVGTVNFHREFLRLVQVDIDAMLVKMIINLQAQRTDRYVFQRNLGIYFQI